MTTTLTHPRLGEIVVCQTHRARRISISVRGTGEVRLSFPVRVPVRRALEFLEQKTEWVERARGRIAARTRPWAEGAGAGTPPETPAQKRERIESLRRAARADLPDRLDRLSRQTGLKYNKLTIRASRTKWGSCSGTNNISLSLHLMTLPEHLRDFVILHELCHTVHHNHSARFHALLDRLTQGNEKRLNLELRACVIRC